MSVTQPIALNELTLVADSGCFRTDDDGSSHELPAVSVRREEDASRVLVRIAVAALSFLLDAAVRLSVRSYDDRLVPQTPDEKTLLVSWGTPMLLRETSFSTMGGSVTGRIDGQDVQAILRQQAGLRIYEDALRSELKTAQFREFWKVLESAFGTINDELLGHLNVYPPVQSLGVDQAELKALLVLRGRASHGQSKAGIRELSNVERDCSRLVPRLKEIAERVLETKASWGYPSVGVKELLMPGRRVSLTERPLVPEKEIRLG